MIKYLNIDQKEMFYLAVDSKRFDLWLYGNG